MKKQKELKKNKPRQSKNNRKIKILKNQNQKIRNEDGQKETK